MGVPEVPESFTVSVTELPAPTGFAEDVTVMVGVDLLVPPGTCAADLNDLVRVGRGRGVEVVVGNAHQTALDAGSGWSKIVSQCAGSVCRQ